MAVKKTAKKSAAKKAPAKKAPAKKAVVKKAPAKKAPVKKKAVVKKTVKKKAVAKKSPSRIVISDDSIITPVIAISSTPFASIPEPATKVSSAIPVVQRAPSSATPQKSSSRVVLLVIVGIVLIAILVVARNHNSTSNNSAGNATPAATASDTSSPDSMTTSSATPSAQNSAPGATSNDVAPIGIVAHYTSSGATVFWAPDPSATGLTTYNVETSSSGGPFKLLATVPSTQTSLNVTKNNAAGWTSFKISAVYSDGGVKAGKVFGLPGQFS